MEHIQFSYLCGARASNPSRCTRYDRTRSDTHLCTKAGDRGASEDEPRGRVDLRLYWADKDGYRGGAACGDDDLSTERHSGEEQQAEKLEPDVAKQHDGHVGRDADPVSALL